ncbi:MAG: large conductance mechanosensitive channel protein MscL [Acidimicrobiia bacterium]|jgi:large conductance mechanosensitive channel
MIREFREFINRGNLVDIAVGFVMGVAFTAVVTTLTTRVVSPLIGLVFDVSGLENLWTFGPVDPATGVPQGSVGALLAALLNFAIVALVIFLVVRAYNASRARWEKEQEEAPEEPTEDTILLREIRDALNR